MKIKKDTILMVTSQRKGRFKAKAARDFDTEKELFYPIIALQKVFGLSTEWEIGDSVPCRAMLTKLEILSQGK